MTGPASSLQLSVAPNPMAGDEVVEDGGVRVFMPPATAEALAGKALDADIDDGGEVSFRVAEPPG
jgi:Fe-S cluster assembly iron-binding protein IscA